MPKTKAPPKLTADEKFFFDNAGYSYDSKTETAVEGKIRCAKQLALAERAAQLSEVKYDWQYEDFPIEDALDPSVYDTREEFKAYCDKYRDNHLCAIIRSKDGEVLGSLGSIIGADANYRRVIEAELALEAFADEYRIV